MTTDIVKAPSEFFDAYVLPTFVLDRVDRLMPAWACDELGWTAEEDAA